MAERQLSGEACAGTVTAAEPDQIDGSGRRRALRPRVTVQTGDPFVAEVGMVLTSPARPKQDAQVISVSAAGGGYTEVVLELFGGMGRSLTAPEGTVPAVGEFVCYATFKDGQTDIGVRVNGSCRDSGAEAAAEGGLAVMPAAVSVLHSTKGRSCPRSRTTC